MDKLLTVRDVAEYLQVSKEKVYKLAQVGKIPVIKIENQWRFKRERLDSWLEANEIGTATLVLKAPVGRKKAQPFLKWAGGKGQLLSQYESLLPYTFNNYLEPFVGAGAVFFHLYNSEKLGVLKSITLIDSNDELVNCYHIIKRNYDKLIKVLKDPKFNNNEKKYYKIRSEQPTDPIERAARMIYLNKTCFNGLYRVNGKGKFNVPYGRYKNPLICDSENLEAVSIALSKVDIVCKDFTHCLDIANKNDFIYFDPPYQPLNKTSSFTSYTKNSFGKNDQERLYETFKELDKRGCKIMLSNSDTPFIRKLYKSFQIKVVSAKRAINCKASGRGEINELVILNY